MILQDIAYLRLMNQSIANSTFSDPADVVKSLGAVQAQDYGQALWAIGSRTHDTTVKGVVQAIESGSILRTWPMRGTIHFVPAEDAKWMISLVSERTLRSARTRHARLDLGEKEFHKAEGLFRQELAGGRRLSRPVLIQLLEDAGISTRNQRGYHILWTLSLTGVLCIGPMEGKQQTYALLDEWAPNGRNLSREEGLGELTYRYFTSHGPATLVDFATWSSQPLRDANIGLEIAKTKLVSKVIEGTEYWMRRDLPVIESQAVRDTYLLAGFEEYLLGYKDRSAVLAAGGEPAAINGIFFPIIVVDGQVKGVWKRVIRRKNIAVSFRPFQKELTPEAMYRARLKARAYGEFMGLPVIFD